MSTVHFVLQGKGGVGKSLIASLLYQYLQQQGIAVTGVDTDPVNATFSGYKALSVQSLDIMDGDDIDQRRFDFLMETILEQTEDSHIVIDNGASTFLPLCSYLKDNAALELLNQEGHAVLLHTVMTGGQAVVDTASGLKTLATSFPSASIVVWLNRYFGDIAMNGKVFEDFKVYQEHYSQFRSIIEVPARKQSTFGKDLEALLSRRETFEAAIHSNQPVMVRQRLKTFWGEVSREVDKAQLIEAQ
nr:conjugal transfer protein TraL [uncultured Desulfobulbus sp.]